MTNYHYAATPKGGQPVVMTVYAKSPEDGAKILTDRGYAVSGKGEVDHAVALKALSAPKPVDDKAKIPLPAPDALDDAGKSPAAIALPSAAPLK